MARRTVRRRKATTRRRRNPIRTTGMILRNPRRKKRRTTKRRRTNPARRRATSRRRPARRRRRNPVRRRAVARRRNPVRRRRTTRRRRRNPSRRRSRAVYRTNPRRRRRNPVRRRRRNPVRRRRTSRRRNPGNALKKIPVIGGLLSSMAGFLPQSLAGALSVEPVMAITRMVSGYVPAASASLVYAVVGTALASAVTMLPFFTKSTREKLAIAIASASGGVAYYKQRTNMDAAVVDEAAQLEMSGAGGLGGIVTGSSYAGIVQRQQLHGGGLWSVQR